MKIVPTENSEPTAVAKREEVVVTPYSTSSSLMAAELSGKRRRPNREGRISAGLSGDQLLASADMSIAEIADEFEVDAASAAKLLERVRAAITKGKSPGMVNMHYFQVRAENAERQAKVDEILGKHPRSLMVQFMMDFDTTASFNYRWYKQDGTAYCISTDELGVALRYDNSGQRARYECKRQECPDFQAPACCTRSGVLYLRLLDLKQAGMFDPFQYVLHGNTADILIGRIDDYAQMLKALQVPMWGPVFELMKVQAKRPYRVMNKATGLVDVRTGTQWVVTLKLRDIGEYKAIPVEERKSLEERINAEAERKAADESDAQRDPDMLDLGVGPEDATYTEITEDDISACPELGPPVEMDDFSLTPQPEAKPFDMTPDAAPAKPKNRKAKEGERVCAAPDCGQYVSDKVAAYCEQSAAYFGNKIYCFDCQGKIRTKRAGGAK